MAAVLEPWQLSDADRIALRVQHARNGQLEIDGTTHPELFLRHELFQAWLTAVEKGELPGDPALQRITEEYRELHALRTVLEERAVLYTSVAPTIPLVSRAHLLQRERWRWIAAGCN